MKKHLITLAAMVAALPGLANAGYHVAGNVQVTTYSTYMAMSAAPSVRYNNSAGGAYVMSQEWSDGTVTFYGRNSAGNIFFCYVPVGSPMFERAQLAHFNLGNGSYVYAT